MTNERLGKKEGGVKEKKKVWRESDKGSEKKAKRKITKWKKGNIKS